jgi:hypothetical protein
MTPEAEGRGLPVPPLWLNDNSFYEGELPCPPERLAKEGAPAPMTPEAERRGLPVPLALPARRSVSRRREPAGDPIVNKLYESPVAGLQRCVFFDLLARNA